MLALYTDGVKQGFFSIGGDQGFNFLLQYGGTLSRCLDIIGKKFPQRVIAAFGNRQGASYATEDIAVPVIDIALLGQRLRHHLPRRVGHGIKSPDTNDSDQNGKKQGQCKTHGQTLADFYIA